MFSFDLASVCEPDPCNGNGRCQPSTSGDTFVCMCQPGFIGPTCESKSTDWSRKPCYGNNLEKYSRNFPSNCNGELSVQIVFWYLHG